MDKDICEFYGWEVIETDDGSGDVFAYWDFQNGESPIEWASSCECVEDIARELKESDFIGLFNNR